MRIVITLKNGENRTYENIDFVRERGDVLKLGIVDSPLCYLVELKEIKEVRLYLL